MGKCADLQKVIVESMLSENEGSVTGTGVTMTVTKLPPAADSKNWAQIFAISEMTGQEKDGKTTVVFVSPTRKLGELVAKVHTMDCLKESDQDFVLSVISAPETKSTKLQMRTVWEKSNVLVGAPPPVPLSLESRKKLHRWVQDKFAEDEQAKWMEKLYGKNWQTPDLRRKIPTVEEKRLTKWYKAEAEKFGTGETGR